MKTKKYIKMNLRLFDGEGGDGGTGVAGEAAAATGDLSALNNKTAVAAGQGVAENAMQTEKEESTVEKTLEQKKTEFEQLINGEYKELFGERLQAAIAKPAEEARKMNARFAEYAPLVDILSEKYGVDSGKVGDIIAAIDKDSTFFEEAALKEGMTVDQYKSMLRMKTQNKQLIEAQRQAEQIRQRDQAWQRWDREAETCRSHYPEFDMNKEIQNENFVRLLGSGFDVENAYKACHFDEIVSGVMTQTKDKTKKQMADSIRSGYARPTENQIGGNAAATQKVDVEKMSYKDMADLIERSRAGEKIVL